MFCILDIKDRKRRFFHKNPPYFAEKIVIPKKAVFEKLTVFSYSGKCDFYAVKEHLKAFSKSVILAENCVLPDSSGLFEFSSNELKARMIFNSAVKLMENVGNRRNITFTLADKTGDFSSLAEEIIPYAGRVNVITDNPVRYRYTSDEIFDNYGAVVSVGEWSNAVPDTDVFVSLSSTGFSPLAVSVKNRKNNGFITLEGDNFTLPDGILKYKPSNVKNYPFASALYSLSSVKTLGGMNYRSFTVNSRQITLNSAAKMLDTLLNI
ncbi:MAG: hypothetical protein K5755_07310 [Clostridiales bacterium]|nr:hypothetical protein [Clostridiales bacterium]